MNSKILDRAKWWNRFPENSTQTKYIRFLKMPESGVVSQFTKAQDEFKRRMELPTFNGANLSL